MHPPRFCSHNKKYPIISRKCPLLNKKVPWSGAPLSLLQAWSQGIGLPKCRLFLLCLDPLIFASDHCHIKIKKMVPWPNSNFQVPSCMKTFRNFFHFPFNRNRHLQQIHFTSKSWPSKAFRDNGEGSEKVHFSKSFIGWRSISFWICCQGGWTLSIKYVSFDC